MDAIYFHYWVSTLSWPSGMTLGQAFVLIVLNKWISKFHLVQFFSPECTCVCTRVFGVQVYIGLKLLFISVNKSASTGHSKLINRWKRKLDWVGLCMEPFGMEKKVKHEKNPIYNSIQFRIGPSVSAVCIFPTFVNNKSKMHEERRTTFIIEEI